MRSSSPSSDHIRFQIPFLLRTLIYLIASYCLLTNMVTAEDSLEEEPFKPELLNTSFRYFSSARIAYFPTSMANLTVFDYIARDLFNRTILKRRMVNGDRSSIIITEVDLIPPKVMPEVFNSSGLAVNYSTMHVAMRPIVAMPFAAGSLSMDINVPTNVLAIGLGGSQMNNFLHYTFPNMNLTVIELESTMLTIARQYFGLKEDAMQRVLVMDGVEFLEKAAIEGQKFDAIYLDACPTRYPFEEVVLCPAHGFLTERTIKNMNTVLKDTGTLSAKMLLYSHNVSRKAHELAEQYMKYFPQCAIMRMASEFNRVLVCSGAAIPRRSLGVRNLEQFAEEFYEKFQLRKMQE